MVGEHPNLVSYHLRRLRDQALVRERRGAVDGRGQATDTTAKPFRPARVLFLCTHNSARSQMAEGILRHLGGDRVEVHSAGTVVTRVHPLSLAAMANKGIDVSQHSSKHIDDFVGQTFDYVVTVCDNARESCPDLPRDPERSVAADEPMGRIRFLLSVIDRKRT